MKNTLKKHNRIIGGVLSVLLICFALVGCAERQFQEKNKSEAIENGQEDTVLQTYSDLTIGSGFDVQSLPVSTESAENVEATILADTIVIEKKSISLKVGKEKAIVATVLPENARNKELVYSSSNKNVASVDENGKITAKKAGEAIIYISCPDALISESVTVTVKEATVHVEKVKFTDRTLTLSVNQTITPVLEYYPKKSIEAQNGEYTLTSSNEEVIKIVKGKIKAVGIGNAIVTVKSGDATNNCKIKVRNIPVKSVSLNCNEKTVKVGDTYQLKATISPNNASDKTIHWYVSNTKVAKVDENGLVTFIGNGHTVIVAETNDWQVYKACFFTIKKK